MTTPRWDKERPDHYCDYHDIKTLPPKEVDIASLTETQLSKETAEELQGISSKKGVPKGRELPGVPKATSGLQYESTISL